MVGRTAIEVALTAKGSDLIRMEGDIAHRLYSAESAFAVCGVRARVLEQLRAGPLPRSTLRTCRRCWADAELMVLAPAHNEVMNDE